MRRAASTVVVAVCAMVSPVLAPSGAGASPAVELVSIGSTGVHKAATSYIPVLSRNGRFVAFLSFADYDSRVNPYLPYPSVYLRDRVAGTTRLVSANFRGDTAALGGLAPFGVSDDGRYVGISGNADLAAPHDGRSHVYVRDTTTGGTTRVDVSDAGVVGAGSASAGGDAPALTPDGRFVVFTSDAPNLVPGDTNGWADVFVRDLATASTRRASLAADGAQANYPSSSGSISDDGRFVAFDSPASNLVSGDTNAGCPGACGSGGDVFVRDLTAGTTERVSVASDGGQSNDSGGRQSYGASITADGRYVSFLSGATNLVPGDTNDASDGFVRDRTGMTTTRVTVAPDGGQLPRGGATVTITGSGNAVLFSADDVAAAAGFRAGVRQLVRRDLRNGVNALASVDAAGAGLSSGPHSVGSISGDGAVVAYDTNQSLVAADQGTTSDVYIAALGPTATVPGTPAVAGVSPGDHSATVTWLKPADGGATIVGYTVTATPGGASCSTSDADALSCTITGLTNGISYTFTVTARNAAGASPPASTGTGTTTPGVAPQPVEGVVPDREPGDGTRATVRWLAAASDLPITGYRVTAEPGGQFCTTTGALFCTVSGLDPATSSTFTVVATNAAGQSDPSDPGTLPADTTAPAVTPVYDRAPLVRDGVRWFDGEVEVGWVVEDDAAGSGVPAANRPPAVTVTSSRPVSSGPVCDAAGNCTTTQITVGIDTTGPAVSIGGVSPGAAYELGSVVQPTCAATDGGVGVDGPCQLTVSGGNGNGVGTFTATATAVDRLGHRTTVAVQYRIVYRWVGFAQPIDDPAVMGGSALSVFKAGSTVPVKFALVGPDGQPISPVTAPVWLLPAKGGPTTLPVDESVYTLPSDSGSAYRFTDGHWQYNWKTDKQQAGYYWRIGVTLDDGVTYFVTVALR